MADHHLTEVGDLRMKTREGGRKRDGGNGRGGGGREGGVGSVRGACKRSMWEMTST